MTVQAIAFACARMAGGTGRSKTPYETATAGTLAIEAVIAAPTVPLLIANAELVFRP